MISQVQQIFNDRTMDSLKLTINAAAERQKALANNVANINTPGYRRVDLNDQFKRNFADALERLDRGERLQSINPQAPYSTISQSQGMARMDGNTVNLEQEMTEMVKNHADFDFATRMLSMRYSGLKAAITGRSG
jgi:flagellar basal-body rod protein FlgB